MQQGFPNPMTFNPGVVLPRPKGPLGSFRHIQDCKPCFGDAGPAHLPRNCDGGMAFKPEQMVSTRLVAMPDSTTDKDGLAKFYIPGQRRTPGATFARIVVEAKPYEPSYCLL